MRSEASSIDNITLIAEFMGMVYDNHNEQPNNYWELTDEQNFVSHKPYPQDKDLKFHSDWNWLMEVVEKIMVLCEKQTTFICHNFRIGVTSINIKVEHERQFKHIDCYYLNYGSKLEAVYNACIEFIKWYNENPAKENKKQ